MEAERIIRRPLATEKSTELNEQHNQYLFEVERRANKIQIKDAVEELFNVRVEKVNTMIVRGRSVRRGRVASTRPNWKKAIVHLHPDDAIDPYEEG